MLICLDQRTGAGCAAENKDGAQFCAQCGRPLQFALHLRNPGELVGYYRVNHLIGHGGFGAVYMADDLQRPGQRVALKETFDADQIQNYQAEFAVLARLQHPHLPRYDRVFEANGKGYLAMELVPGQSLEEVLQKQGGPLLEAQVLGYALQLCDALAYLHSQKLPILHRDIKPANVRLTPEGVLKLVDFGLVKEGGGPTRSVRRGVTPAYAPPEQWGMGGQHTDARSDIYALAATLYHLLTNVEPPAATDRISMLPDPLRAPHHVNPHVSPVVSAAILQAMALPLPYRPADVAAFRLLLWGGVSGAPPATLPGAAGAPPPKVPRLSSAVAPPVQPRWRLSPFLISLLVVAGLALAIGNWSGRTTGRAALPPDTATATEIALAPIATPLPPVTAAVTATTPAPTATPLAPTRTPTPVQPAAGALRVNPFDDAVYVYVPAGDFTMGSEVVEVAVALTDCRQWGSCEPGWFEVELPSHQVELDGYWIMQTEVTNALYGRCVAARVCTEPANSRWDDVAYIDHPVTDVDWSQAVTYATWIGGRLPSEAEWEKAARGSDRRTFPWGAAKPAPALANYGATVGDTQPVGRYPAGASPYGALDMAGNVWEWVGDWYGVDAYANSSAANPAGPADGTWRVVRGGSWGGNAVFIRSAFRNGNLPSVSSKYGGFRVVDLE